MPDTGKQIKGGSQWMCLSRNRLDILCDLDKKIDILDTPFHYIIKDGVEVSLYFVYHKGIYSSIGEIKSLIKKYNQHISEDRIIKDKWDKAINEFINNEVLSVESQGYFESLMDGDKYDRFYFSLKHIVISCPDEKIFQTKLFDNEFGEIHPMDHSKTAGVPFIRDKLGFETPFWTRISRGMGKVPAINTDGNEILSDASEIVEWNEINQYTPLFDKDLNYVSTVQGTTGFSIKYNVGLHSLIETNSRPVTFRKVHKNCDIINNYEAMGVLSECWSNKSLSHWSEFTEDINVHSKDLSTGYETFTSGWVKAG